MQELKDDSSFTRKLAASEKSWNPLSGQSISLDCDLRATHQEDTGKTME